MLKDILWVSFLSASPISELKGGIPLGIAGLHLSPLLVFWVAIVANFLIVPLLLIFLHYFSEFLMHRFYYFNRLLSFVFDRTQRKHSQAFEKWEELALLIFVAIPLPMTGAWTGCIAAFLFGIPFKRSMLLIFLGNLIAGLIVTALTLLSIDVVNGLK